MHCAVVDVIDRNKIVIGTYTISLCVGGFVSKDFEREALKCAIEDGLAKDRAREYTFTVRSNQRTSKHGSAPAANSGLHIGEAAS